MGGGIVATGNILIFLIIVGCFLTALFEIPKDRRLKRERKQQELELCQEEDDKKAEEWEKIRRLCRPPSQVRQTSYGCIVDYR